VAPGELDRQPAAERDAAHVRAREPDDLDELGQAVRVPGEAEILRWVERPSAPRGVPRDDGEVAGEAVELRQPVAAVSEGPVQKDEGRAVALPPVGDAASADLDVLFAQLSDGVAAVTIQVEAIPQIEPSSRWNSANASRSAASTFGM